MKKMKFRKLSRVLISISLLAIIAVSLISVPVSAAEGDNSFVGTWVIDKPFVNSLSSGDVLSNVYVEGEMHLITSLDQDDVITSSTYYMGYYALRQNEELISALVLSTYYQGEFYFYTYLDNEIIVGIGNVSTVSFRISSDHPLFDTLRTFTITAEPTNIQTSGVTLDDFYNALTEVASPYVPPQPRSLLDNIFGTFSEVGSWIGTIISSLVALFWSVETASLTFLGILSVAGLAFSVIMLLFSFVTRFVGFSG